MKLYNNHDSIFYVEPPDGITPTVGFSNANLTIASCNVTLYDLGGGINVRTVWKKYFADVSILNLVTCILHM